MAAAYTGRHGYDNNRRAKLGTETNPAMGTVQSQERLNEINAIFEEHGWIHAITVDAEKPEQISDLDALLNPVKTAVSETKAGRNDPCPCGSGKKYKKCCGA